MISTPPAEYRYGVPKLRDFPHMSVRKNVEFGLTNRNMSKTEIRQRAERFLDLMQIGELADRMPNSLSGGQQQRVALARRCALSQMFC